jgi:SAM-dependent methyltransferase
LTATAGQPISRQETFLTDIPRIFDPAALRARRRRALRIGSGGFLVRHLAAELSDRLGGILRDFPLALDLATPGSALTALLRADPRIGTVIRAEATSDALADDPLAFAADPAVLPLAPDALALACSVLGLSAVDDLPGALLQIRRALKPDGLFIAALLGEGTLTELRQSFADAESRTLGGISPRVAPFADVRSLGALMQRAGFALPVVDAERLVVRYADPLALMQDLRAEGLSNPLAERLRRPLRRDTLFRAAATYAERFSDPDGRIRATFEIVWLSGWAPAENQQKPLRPGSARMRLAEALGAVETKLPD